MVRPAKDLTLAPGDLLFVEGSGSVTEVGRAAVWDGAVPDCIHQNSVIRARLETKELDPQFVITWFNSRAGNAYIRAQATTTSGLFHIGAGKLAHAPVPIPALQTQRDLVQVVADALEDARKADAEAVELRLQAWREFDQQVTHATSGAAEFAEASIHRFAALDRWDTAVDTDSISSPFPLSTLGSVAEIRLGVQVPAKHADAPGEQTPYLRAANVQAGLVNLDDVRTMAATEQTVDRLQLRRDDVLVVEGNSHEEVGRAAVWEGDDDPVIIQNSVIRVRLTEAALTPRFLVTWLNSPAGRAYARRKATTTSGSLWHIGAGKLAGAPVPLPPVDVQQKLVQELEHALLRSEATALQAADHRQRAETAVERALLH